MLSHRNTLKIFTALLIGAASIKVAAAGLYGFHHYNPYTDSERILDFQEVPQSIPNYRSLMRDNLLMLIRYGKEQKPDFQIIAHEGQDLLTKSLWEYEREGYNQARHNENAEDKSFLFNDDFVEKEPLKHTPAYEYLHSVDAVVLNNFYCGNNKENRIVAKHNLGKITIEQCNDEDALASAYINAMIDKKISYVFTDIDKAFNNTDEHNDLNDSSANIYTIDDAQNILFLTDITNYKDKDALIEALAKTNYDIIVIPALYDSGSIFSAADIERIRFKHNGAKRLLIATLNVSEASPEDYFWDKDWKQNHPEWLVRKSFSTEDAYITQYWHPQWQEIISRYFRDIIRTGFDGVFFTGVENYKYFERQTPLE